MAAQEFSAFGGDNKYLCNMDSEDEGDAELAAPTAICKALPVEKFFAGMDWPAIPLPGFERWCDPPKHCLCAAAEPETDAMLLPAPCAKSVPSAEWRPEAERPDSPFAGKYCGVEPDSRCVTPEPMRVPSTPPPLVHRTSIIEEIDQALIENSWAMLNLALLSGHRCSKNHSVCEAVRRCHLPALEFLLNHQSGQDLDDHCCGDIPLCLAIRSCLTYGDVGYKMAKMLLQHGASPNACCNYWGKHRPPIFDAVERRCESAVELLLEYGASVDIADRDGSTVLHAACRQLLLCQQLPCMDTSQKHIVECLLRKGADPTQANSAGISPVLYTQDPELNQKMVRAMNWWGRREFDALCGKSSTRHQSANFSGASEACEACLRFSDVSDTIASFL